MAKTGRQSEIHQDRTQRLLQEAELKFKEGDANVKRRDFERSERLFREALRQWLFLTGANSGQVLRCHARLKDLACLQRDVDKAEYHTKAVERIRCAQSSDERTCSESERIMCILR
ncbi:hypothetical protein ACHAXT_006860 [Thalassiosira profunda]